MKKLTITHIASAALRTNKKSYVSLIAGIFLSIFFVSCMVLGVHGLFMANEARRDARLGSQDAFWLDCEETDEVLMASGLYDAIGHVTIPAVHNDTSTSIGYYDDTILDVFIHLGDCLGKNTAREFGCVHRYGDGSHFNVFLRGDSSFL